MKQLIKLLLTISFFAAFSSHTYAQVSTSINLNPANPEPRSNVTLTLESYSMNVSTANIVWKINGKVVLQGQGEKVLTFRTGSVGESFAVTATAEGADGTKVETAISVTPSSVTLLYEAPQSYVPIFYEGRSLASTGGLIRVSALPSLSDNGLPVSPEKLSYTWYVNDAVFKTASGLGKQAALIRLDYLKSKTDIKVIVRSPLGNTGEKTMSIYPHQILPMVYLNDAVFGPDFTKAIMGRFEAVSDFTLSLEPFYVSDESARPANFSWYLDGLPSTPLGGRVLGLHPKENSYGSKILTIDVTGGERKIQKAQTRIELIFDTRK